MNVPQSQEDLRTHVFNYFAVLQTLRDEAFNKWKAGTWPANKTAKRVRRCGRELDRSFDLAECRDADTLFIELEKVIQRVDRDTDEGRNLQRYFFKIRLACKALVDENDSSVEDLHRELMAMSPTPFSDIFLAAERRVTYYTLGANTPNILKAVDDLELNDDEVEAMLEASGIDVRGANWLIGQFHSPVTLCGTTYQPGTVAVFRSRKPGSRFAVFSRPYDSGGDDVVGWGEIRETMESIRSDIGDLMDWIGDIGAENDPDASRVSEDDRRKPHYSGTRTRISFFESSCPPETLEAGHGARLGAVTRGAQVG